MWGSIPMLEQAWKYRNHTWAESVESGMILPGKENDQKDFWIDTWAKVGQKGRCVLKLTSA